MLKNWPKILLVMVLFGVFLHPINLVTADLGRHIKNGELTLINHQVPELNIYSYTYPNYPFINHHWLTGVVFYLVKTATGFDGLSLMMAIISAMTVILGVDLVWKKSGWAVALASLIVFLPLLLSRLEIRPEIFSTLFTAVFFWVLWRYQTGTLGTRWLWILVLIELFWVNLHIYFFLGWGLIGVFWFENLIRSRDKLAKKRLVWMSLIGVAGMVVTLINPSGIWGALRPFMVYQNYGYRVLEEQNVGFLESVYPLPVLSYFFLGIAILIGSWLWKGWRVINKHEDWSWSLLILSIGFGVFGWMMLRNFQLFGLVALIVVGLNLVGVKDLVVGFKQWAIWSGLVILLVVVICINSDYWVSRSQFGIGLEKGNSLSGEFMVREKLRGPIFNNYDIGGYLIYYLYPDERVFVDNRPEVYPSEFFQNVLIRSQENEEEWQNLDKKYGFQAIVFSWHDATPWGQNFLVNRVKDDNWQVVWLDEWVIILVKKYGLNQTIADKYLVPKDVFVMK